MGIHECSDYAGYCFRDDLSVEIGFIEGEKLDLTGRIRIRKSPKEKNFQTHTLSKHSYRHTKINILKFFYRMLKTHRREETTHHTNEM